MSQEICILDSNKYLLIGPSKCGKSAQAEMLAYKSGLTRYYFATLPATQTHKPKINNHIQQRGLGWNVYEVCGERSIDFQKLDDALSRNAFVLIDGLRMWAEYFRGNIGLLEFAEKITISLYNASATWCVVDAADSFGDMFDSWAWESLFSIPGLEIINFKRSRSL